MGRNTVRVFSAGATGLEAHLIEVEVGRSIGTNHFQLIGLPDSTVRESAHRILSVLANCQLAIPRGPILVNLAPAATRKQGAALDLAMALGVAAAGGNLPTKSLEKTLVLGELSLDGKVRSAGKAFLAGCLARKRNFERILCPETDGYEISLASGPVKILPVKELLEAVLILNGKSSLREVNANPEIGRQKIKRQPDLADVKGQPAAVRALVVTAAGGHHLLLTGPPGSGKSFLAMRCPGLLPALEIDGKIEVTRIRSAAGLVVNGLAKERPFRAPHHTISYAGLIGGGRDPRPGEITLAHRGVLFLDELPEFDRHTLEVLRQPLEEGVVRLGRAQATKTFPAGFLLIAAMNPCPCGYLGHPTEPCRCHPRAVASYQGRISGPLLDRLDLRVWMPPVDPNDLLGPKVACQDTLTTAKGRAMVLKTRAIQIQRFRGEDFSKNSEIPSALLDKYAPIGKDGKNLLIKAMRNLHLSARGLVRIRRLARTIADLAGRGMISENDILEALAYRGKGL